MLLRFKARKDHLIFCFNLLHDAALFIVIPQGWPFRLAKNSCSKKSPGLQDTRPGHIQCYLNVCLDVECCPCFLLSQIIAHFFLSNSLSLFLALSFTVTSVTCQALAFPLPPDTSRVIKSLSCLLFNKLKGLSSGECKLFKSFFSFLLSPSLFSEVFLKCGCLNSQEFSSISMP